MPSPRLRVIASVLAAAVLLVGVSGCGAENEKSKSIDPAVFIKHLTDAMAKQGSAHMELQLGSSIQASADLRYAQSGNEMDMRMVTGKQTVRVVLAGGALYLQQTKGDKFLKIDSSDPALGSLLDQVSSMGPQATINGLKPAVKKVVDRGTETLDGQKLNHYVLTVDTAKVKANFGALGANVKLPKTVSYDVYYGSDFLVREVRITVSGQKLVMKASKWGEPVTITVPSPSQVISR